jgi:hypothetical protein
LDKLVAETGIDRRLLDVVEVSRTFDGTHYMSFSKYQPVQDVSGYVVRALFEVATNELTAMSELAKESGLKAQLLFALQSDGDAVKDESELTATNLNTIVDGLGPVFS